MNKPDLIEYMMASTAHYNHKDITQAVNVILSAIEDSLASGGRTEIRGFGTFDLRYHPPRVGRNPRTGESINVTGGYRPHFKPGKRLREIVDRGEVKEET
ncbi:MAG: integration host factor subunit beta [Candidatus Kentron sp. G]|nr:MAG: integration host factor subunit beta [Candidatus Kentron sp. G]